MRDPISNPAPLLVVDRSTSRRYSRTSRRSSSARVGARGGRFGTGSAPRGTDARAARAVLIAGAMGGGIHVLLSSLSLFFQGHRVCARKKKNQPERRTLARFSENSGTFARERRNVAFFSGRVQKLDS